MKKCVLSVWDFDALHGGVMDLRHGSNWFRQFSNALQPRVVDVPRIVEFIQRLSPDSWHNAYGDWRYLEAYAADLEAYHLQPIQCFPAGRGQTYRVETLVNELLDRPTYNDQIRTVILAGATHRTFSLVEQLKRKDIKVVAILPPREDGKELSELCDRIIDYSQLCDPLDSTILEHDREILIKAMQNISRRTGNIWIRRVRIKPAMVEIDPNFDEKRHGYPKFSLFLDGQTDVLERRYAPHQREPEYRLLKAPFGDDDKYDHHSKPDSYHTAVSTYCRISADQGLRLPAPDVMWIGIDIYSTFLNDPEGFASFGELDDECLDQLRLDIPDATMTDAKKVRQVLFKCYLFSPGDGVKIGFREDVHTLEDVEDLYFTLIINRVAFKAPTPIDFAALSQMATGEPDNADRLARQYEKLLVQDSQG